MPVSPHRERCLIRLGPLILLAMMCVTTLTMGSPASASELMSNRQPLAAARRLAEKHVPIVMLKRQEAACDAAGEPFAPAPLEVVFGDPAVVLHDGARDDQLVERAPAAADLFHGDDNLYLDLPGNPRAPGCDFERHFKDRMGSRAPVAYARILTDGVNGRLVLQYWFYYYFNDFNNTHESDWEMIQLRFDAGSAIEALEQQPVEIALAQHGGGETASWDDPKLQREGTHPVLYPAAGSHATHYDSAVYLGWGEHGTGFGCDTTTGPSVRVPLEARLIPDETPDRASPFAWTTYRGHWGEKQPWEYNGPTGPNTKVQWDRPIQWQAGLRDDSIEVLGAETFGPGPTSVFCTTVGFGSLLLTRYQVYPWWMATVVVAIVGCLFAIVIAGRTTLDAAWVTYAGHWRLFASLGLLLIPIGILANGFQYLVLEYPPGNLIFEVLNKSPGARLAAALTVGGIQQLAGTIIIGPAVIQAVADIQAGRRPGFRRAYRVVMADIRRLVIAVLRSAVIVAALALVVVGIPWAVAYSIRWLFVAQAVIVDGATPRQAMAKSVGVVAGRWWRTAGTALLLGLVGTMAGPLLGIILLVWASRSVAFVNVLSSLIYAIMLPLSIIGFTHLYRELKSAGPAP